jgi:hypothetical protein
VRYKSWGTKLLSNAGQALNAINDYERKSLYYMSGRGPEALSGIYGIHAIEIIP